MQEIPEEELTDQVENSEMETPVEGLASDIKAHPADFAWVKQTCSGQESVPMDEQELSSNKRVAE
ncbi:hypothetical protein [Haloparvum sp. AD34]